MTQPPATIFVITGPAGAGKTTLVNELKTAGSQLEVRDLDEYNPGATRDDNWRLGAYECFLNEAIAGEGQWLLAGQIPIPEFLKVVRALYFGSVYCMAINVNEQERVKRLRDRGWSDNSIVGQSKWIAEYLDNSRCVQASLDSTSLSPKELSDAVLNWVQTILGDEVLAKRVSGNIEQSKSTVQSAETWSTLMPKATTIERVRDIVTAHPAASYFDIYHPLPFSGIADVRTAVNKQEFYRKTQSVLDGVYKHLTLNGKAVSGAKVLDLGANGGGLSFRLALSGVQVVAAEADLNYVELGRAVSRIEGVAVEWRHATLDSVVKEDDHFDIALVLSVFQWAAQGGKSISSASKSLRKLSEHSDALIFELGYNFGTQCLTTEEADHYSVLLKLLLNTTVYTNFELLTTTELYPGQTRYMVYCSGRRKLDITA